MREIAEALGRGLETARRLHRAGQGVRAFRLDGRGSAGPGLPRLQRKDSAASSAGSLLDRA